jgi:hypothetical protein
MKTIGPSLDINFLIFHAKQLDVFVSFFKLGTANGTLVENLNGVYELAEILPVSIRQYTVQERRCKAIKVRLPLFRFVATIDFFSDVSRRMIYEARDILATCSDGSTMFFPHLPHKRSPVPIVCCIFACTSKSLSPEWEKKVAHV